MYVAKKDPGQMSTPSFPHMKTSSFPMMQLN